MKIHHRAQLIPVPDPKGRKYNPPAVIPNVVTLPLNTYTAGAGTPAHPKKHRNPKLNGTEKSLQNMMQQRRKVPEPADKRDAAVKAMLAQSQRVAQQELMIKVGTLQSPANFSPAPKNTNVGSRAQENSNVLTAAPPNDVSGITSQMSQQQIPNANNINSQISAMNQQRPNLTPQQQQMLIQQRMLLQQQMFMQTQQPGNFNQMQHILQSNLNSPQLNQYQQQIYMQHAVNAQRNMQQQPNINQLQFQQHLLNLRIQQQQHAQEQQLQQQLQMQQHLQVTNAASVHMQHQLNTENTNNNGANADKEIN